MKRVFFFATAFFSVGLAFAQLKLNSVSLNHSFARLEPDAFFQIQHGSTTFPSHTTGFVDIQYRYNDMEINSMELSLKHDKIPLLISANLGIAELYSRVSSSTTISDPVISTVRSSYRVSYEGMTFGLGGEVFKSILRDRFRIYAGMHGSVNLYFDSDAFQSVDSTGNDGNRYVVVFGERSRIDAPNHNKDLNSAISFGASVRLMNQLELKGEYRGLWNITTRNGEIESFNHQLRVSLGFLFSGRTPKGAFGVPQ